MEVTGAILKQARKDKGFVSLPLFAELAFISHAHLWRVENNKRPVTLNVIEAYERVLGVEIMERRDLLKALSVSAVVPVALSEQVWEGIDRGLSGQISHDEWLSRLRYHAFTGIREGVISKQAEIIADLQVLQRTAHDPRDWGIVARMLVLHGTPVASINDNAACVRWSDLAARAAMRSEDRDVQVWVLGRSANSHAHPSADLRACESLANKAIAVADGKPSVGLLDALVSKANVYALSGNPQAAAETLEKASAVFDRAGTDSAAAEWDMPFWRWAANKGQVLARAGHKEAPGWQDRADKARPAEFARFATHVELHRALVMTKQGDKEAGHTYAMSAMTKLPQERHSVALRRILAEVQAA
ncbi:helix-turn-helix domain-containing protein [Longispora albida]|uniref:helix-turn-helix domain-containing protein n=1 Tax=Longispora albida TaxID=203523 RepID=UPI000365AA71|nr:helix-turn-helix transcriptional regulator [Longispora albida]